MTQEKLEEKLKKLIFEKDKPFVVSISGEWGVGKTYFLQKFFIEKYKEELDRQIQLKSQQQQRNKQFSNEQNINKSFNLDEFES